MEVVVLSPNGSPTTMDNFDFNRARISPPYLSAPSSPKRFGEGYYMSAPTSPTRLSDVSGADFDYYVPSSLYHWEDKPGAHKSNHKDDDDDDDDDGGGGGFAFSVGGGSDESSRPAEELFHGGKIKPLKGDRELMESSRSPLLSSNNPRSNSPIIAQGKKNKGIREMVSSQKKKLESGDGDGDPSGGERRGRERAPPGGAGGSFSVSKSGRRATRSLSPFRVSDSTWDEELQQPPTQNNNKELGASALSSSSSKSGSRKWRLRDLLLFRSASEGRGSNKDPFRKYAVMFRKSEEGKVSSFRSSSDQNPMIPRPRRKEPVSAHELHYARKKAEAEDLKKRTFLPYKQGILGRLAGLGSLSK